MSAIKESPSLIWLHLLSPARPTPAFFVPISDFILEQGLNKVFLSPFGLPPHNAPGPEDQKIEEANRQAGFFYPLPTQSHTPYFSG